MDLKGKYVVITGVSRGIGNALVYQFLAKGCLVGGMGLTDPKLDHPNFSFYKTDVRKSENVQNSFRAFLGESNNLLDILVNNSDLGTLVR